jgi:DNA helicase-2/ATP-dependent DNA helicase PcrA
MTEIENKIFENATPDQLAAICHKDSHARLLAGPGTGKTFVLTRKVLWLILEQNINPKDILALTFTRLAAAQLKNDLRAVLEPHGLELPVVATLHSFALRQILRNSLVVEELPRPIRVADDWEERNLIQEDIKKIIQVRDIKEVRLLINRLSADWEQLRADESGWLENFPNSKFIGAINQHKEVYGETMRSELVYKLKKSLEQNENFRLDNSYKYVLIDEYQDLNACDLSIARSLSERGSTLFVVGDDDQSIYGFRFANPVGIRQFPEVYENAQRLELEICYRCDKQIISQAEFVANQDIQRMPKSTKPRSEAGDGKVVIFRYIDQNQEAKSTVEKIKELIKDGMPEEKIVVLSRNASILRLISDTLVDNGIMIAGTSDFDLENLPEFRVVLSIFRLLSNIEDDLAWRTLIELAKNNVGEKSIDSIFNVAVDNKLRFYHALQEIKKNKTVSKYGEKINSFVEKVEADLEKFSKIENLPDKLNGVIDNFVENIVLREKILKYFTNYISSESDTLDNVVKSIGVNSDRMEQNVEKGAVSILTMHKAKGLTFDACFIVGAEDEFLPGKNEGEFIGDERRLLYVSMTRARHYLFISYCSKRIGTQKFIGRVPGGGQEKRTLTRFLRDSKIEIIAQLPGNDNI